MIRVLVADDHSLFRDGITSLLTAAGYAVVGQVGDGAAAEAAVLELQPDLLLLDISMPRRNGLEALARIKASSPGTRVVMLTVSDDEADLLAAIQAGAEGYLLKSLNAEEFLAALHALQRGELAITHQLASRLILGMVRSSQPSPEPGEALTGRELELLRLVAEGLSNRAVALRLSISENTVKYHLKKILQKLHAQNRTEAVSYAARSGLLEPPE